MPHFEDPAMQRCWSIARTTNRRAARHNIPGRLKRTDIKNLFETQNQCLNCGTTARLTVDHIRPLSQGGPNELSNLQILCFSCNRQKALGVTDFRPRRKSSN